MIPGSAVWTALLGVAVLVEWRARALGLGSLVRRVGEHAVGRFVLAAAWVFLGVHLFARIGSPAL